MNDAKTPHKKAEHAQLEGLATLLVLNDEIRKLNSIREFGFFCTNETHRLIPYHTAYLWGPSPLNAINILAQSGIAEPDIHAAPNRWLMLLIQKIKHSNESRKIHLINTEDLLIQDQNQYDDMPLLDQSEQFPTYFLWCPFLDKSSELIGGLIFSRETPFSESEMKMLRWLNDSYQYTWLSLYKQSRLSQIKKLKEKPYKIIILFILLAIFLFPTRLTVIGSGTVSPKDPILINAPLQGVIKSFAVNPGDTVRKGQLLFVLDKTDLESTLEVNKRDYALTQAKLRSAVNEGFSNQQSRAEIPLLQAQLNIDKAHYDYTNELLQKTNVTSPINGIVIFDSKEDWIGQPVQTGERILVIANPQQIELKISLPIANSIDLAKGGAGTFYAYGQFRSIPVRLRTLGYNAELTPNKILAYNLVADFTQTKSLPQLGTQGTVELYGKRVPFIYYLLRRPLQTFRQTLGI